MPVLTLVGVLAKARADLAVADRWPENDEINGYSEWLVYADLEDLVRAAGGAS
jgi:hypothetical protein